MSDFSPISNINGSQNIPPDSIRSRKRRERVSLDPDKLMFSAGLERQDALVEKLMNMSEVRPEMVELGKRLAQAEDYPSSETLDQLAAALTGSFEDIAQAEDASSERR